MTVSCRLWKTIFTLTRTEFGTVSQFRKYHHTEKYNSLKIPKKLHRYQLKSHNKLIFRTVIFKYWTGLPRPHPPIRLHTIQLNTAFVESGVSNLGPYRTARVATQLPVIDSVRSFASTLSQRIITRSGNKSNVFCLLFSYLLRGRYQHNA